MRDTINTLLETVSANVKRLLEEADRTQRMASGSGVSQKTVSNLANMGVKKPKRGTTLGTLQAFADQLDLPTYQLLINNLPESSARRKQLDRLIRTFVGATSEQQDWLIQTLEMMGQFGPKSQNK